MCKRKDDPQEKDPIDALEELTRGQLQQATTEGERKILEEQLAFCNDLRRICTLKQEMENASPEEKAYYAFLDELDQIKKQRAGAQISREEALYLIARLILPKEIASEEVGFRSLSPSLWSRVERVLEQKNVCDEEYFQLEEDLDAAHLSIDKIERHIQKMVAARFRHHGEPELADLYKNDLPEFLRLYEEGKKIADRSAGPH